MAWASALFMFYVFRLDQRQRCVAIGAGGLVRPDPMDLLRRDRCAAVGADRGQEGGGFDAPGGLALLLSLGLGLRSRGLRLLVDLPLDQCLGHAADGHQHQDPRPPPVLPSQDRQADRQTALCICFQYSDIVVPFWVDQRPTLALCVIGVYRLVVYRALGLTSNSNWER